MLTTFALFVISVGLAQAGPKSSLDAPGLMCAGSTPSSIAIQVCAGASGALAGFSIQWMTCAEYVAGRDGIIGTADDSSWPDSDSPVGQPSFCTASFSGNANRSSYCLPSGGCVIVNIGNLLNDPGASTTCPNALSCERCYVFRAFAHANTTKNRSAFTGTLTCSTLNTPPTIVCPTALTVNADPDQCSAANVTYTATATDTCDPNPTVRCTPASGSTFPIGSTTVTCSATDASGNSSSCTFTVTVRDTIAPTISCPANRTVSTDPGQCAAANVTFAANATDKCDPHPMVSCTPPSGSTFPIGTTTVTCTATDASGNSTSCSFTLRVVDTTAPIITCPANLTASPDPGQCSTATVTYTATATDNCNPNQTVLCAPPSGSTFLPGSTTVTCTATDASDNSSSCSFTVTFGTAITACPITITSPGLYFLATDLAVAAGTAIGISANNVCLDLQGHTLSGPNLPTSGCTPQAADGIVLGPTTSNVHINNGTVQGFMLGIVVAGSSDIHINGLTVTKNWRGVQVVDGAHDNHINGNDISGNCETAVLIGVGPHHNEFIGNTVNNNGFGGGGGGFLASSDDTVISGNEISGNQGFGVWLFAGADGNIVDGNTVNANTSSGMRIDCGSIGNVFEGNVVDSLGPFAHDLIDYNLSSPCTNGCVNMWINNTFMIDNEGGTDFGPGAGCIQ